MLNRRDFVHAIVFPAPLAAACTAANRHENRAAMHADRIAARKPRGPASPAMDLSTHRHFVPWTDPETQVTTFLPVVVYRILADRFYTKDFNEDTYTKYGIERIRDVRLYDIIKKHYGPALLPKSREEPIFFLWQHEGKES